MFSPLPGPVARVLVSGAIALAVGSSMPVSTKAIAQTPAGPGTPEVTRALESARASKAAGRIADAIEIMAPILKKFPGHAEAATFQIESLVALDRFADALTTYDLYAGAIGKPDVAALGRIARADLARTARARSDQPILRAQVLERLARFGDGDAVTALRQQAGSTSVVTPESLAPVIALARLKDPAGGARLAEMLRSSTGTVLAQVVQALTQADVRSEGARLVPLLGDADIHVRNATATALGMLQVRQAVPQLRNAFENDSAGSVKMFAAVSLRQLGDSSADAFLEKLLRGDIAEVQVIAAGGWQFATARTPSWEKAVRTLLASANEMHRLRAAELLACCDRVAARNVLTSALASPNPVLRGGAARVLEAHPELADAALARRLLGDTADTVRANGAGLAMALSSRQRGSGPGLPTDGARTVR